MGKIKLKTIDFLKMILLLMATTVVGLFFVEMQFSESNIIPMYILGVLLVALFTKSYICSILSSLLSVMLFNFFFTMPRFTFHAYDPDYPVTFGIMLVVSLITGTMANQLQNHAKESAQAAYRTQILLDTSQLLQKAKDDYEIVYATAHQLLKLLERDLIIYLETDHEIKKGYYYAYDSEIKELSVNSFGEQIVIDWVYKNNQPAGIFTSHWADAKYQYLPIAVTEKVYGVAGIQMENNPLDDFEKSILKSILGECALALENMQNAREKERAAVLAKNEQLRANLLRSISHDLRTPLTSISGNADNLLRNYHILDDIERFQAFSDIYDDSIWLINLVENLLSVTRIEDGSMKLNMSTELVEEVVQEALLHIDRRSEQYHISINIQDELLLARMDAKLIVQVPVNIIDNAIKYTPEGSSILISAKTEQEMIAISIADNGQGIPDKDKSQVFEMFFTGENKIADSRRSLGLGLALCKSIINTHGGEIYLTDNVPTGCIFTFTLPAGEVIIHE